MKQITPRSPGWLWTAAALPLLFASAVQGGFQEGMDFFKAGKCVEASAEFQALVDESPEYDYGYFMLGVCNVKMGKPGDAEKNIARAIELNGDKFEYHFALANLYQQKGQFAKVVSTLNSVEGLVPDPHRYNFHQLRGFAEASLKDWEEAIGDLEKAIAVKSEPAVLTQLGKAYFTTGQYEKAVEKLRDASRLKPDEAENHELIADALMNLAAKASSDSQKEARYGEALAEAQKNLDLKPTSRDARYLLARAALGAGQHDKAIDSLNKVLSLDPNNCNAMVNLGMALIAKKDWPNALQALDNATTCDPKMAVAWHSKGFVLQKQGTEGKSVEKYQAAISAYGAAEKLKPSPANAKSIETCQQNIDVIEHNTTVARLEDQQDAEAAAAQEEYEKKLQAQKEWEKKQEEGK